MKVMGKRVAAVLGFAWVQSVVAVASIFPSELGRFAVFAHHEIFYRYACEAVAGRVPYRDYLVEYPLLAFPLMLAPRLVASDLPGYSLAYIAMLLGFNLATLALVARQAEREGGPAAVVPTLTWYTWFFVALCPLLLGPFDLAPTMLAFLAATAWGAGRGVGGGVVAALGALMKVFPAAVALPGLVMELADWRRTRLRGAVAFALTFATGMLLWSAIGGRGLADSLRYHAERGLQVESTWAGLLMLRGVVIGVPFAWTFDHSAAHLSGDLGDRLASLALPTQLLIFAVVARRFARSGRADPSRFAAAAILGFMVGGKVLSPQFLIWLIPFVAVLRGPSAPLCRRIYLASCVMSSLSFPWGVLLFLLNGYRWAIVFLNVRNALLIWLLAMLLFDFDPGKDRSRDEQPPEAP